MRASIGSRSARQTVPTRNRDGRTPRRSTTTPGAPRPPWGPAASMRTAIPTGSPPKSGTSSWGAADLSSADLLRTVVALADPGRCGEALGPRPDPRAVDAALRLAKPNGLLTAVGLGLAAEGIEIPEGWRTEFEAERRSLGAGRASRGLTREVASDDGLAVAVIKNVSALEHAPRDVDVFVPEAECPVLLAALRARGRGAAFDDGEEAA